jgi:excisionase family DNA binding protein
METTYNTIADSSTNQRASRPQTLMTIADFCSEYRVSRSSVYRLINAGLIPIVKVGRATRIRTADAERWAASLTETNMAA